MIITAFLAPPHAPKAIGDLEPGDWIRVTEQEYHAFVMLSVFTAAGGYKILLDNGTIIRGFDELTDTVEVLTNSF